VQVWVPVAVAVAAVAAQQRPLPHLQLLVLQLLVPVCWVAAVACAVLQEQLRRVQAPMPPVLSVAAPHVGVVAS
jgi:hypothetical protein